MWLKALTIFSGSALIFSVLFEEFMWLNLWILSVFVIGVLILVSLIIMVVAVVKRNKNIFLLCFSSLVISAAIYVSSLERFKSPPILKATLVDDLSLINLTLRSNRQFEVEPVTWMGPAKIFKGSYKIDHENIIFLDPPYDNDFIPDTVQIIKNKIILNGDLVNPDTTFANFFEIKINEINR